MSFCTVQGTLKVKDTVAETVLAPKSSVATAVRRRVQRFSRHRSKSRTVRTPRPVRARGVAPPQTTVGDPVLWTGRGRHCQTKPPGPPFGVSPPQADHTNCHPNCPRTRESFYLPTSPPWSSCSEPRKPPRPSFEPWRA